MNSGVFIICLVVLNQILKYIYFSFVRNCYLNFLDKLTF